MLKLIMTRLSIKKLPLGVLKTAASSASLSVLKHILMINTEPIIRDIIIAAARNRSVGAEKLRLVWDCAPEIEPCIEMLIKPGGLYDYGDDNIDLVIDRVRDEGFVQEILEAAAGRRNSNAVTIVHAMLDHGIPVMISYDLITKAIRSGNGAMVLLVMKTTSELKVDQELVNMAVEQDSIPFLQYLANNCSTDELDLKEAYRELERWEKDQALCGLFLFRD